MRLVNLSALWRINLWVTCCFAMLTLAWLAIQFSSCPWSGSWPEPVNPAGGGVFWPAGSGKAWFPSRHCRA